MTIEELNLKLISLEESKVLALSNGNHALAISIQFEIDMIKGLIDMQEFNLSVEGEAK